MDFVIQTDLELVMKDKRHEYDEVILGSCEWEGFLSDYVLLVQKSEIYGLKWWVGNYFVV